MYFLFYKNLVEFSLSFLFFIFSDSFLIITVFKLWGIKTSIEIRLIRLNSGFQQPKALSVQYNDTLDFIIREQCHLTDFVMGKVKDAVSA